MDWLIWVLITGFHALAAWQVFGFGVLLTFVFYTAPFNPLGYAKVMEKWSASPIQGFQYAWWSSLFWPAFAFGLLCLFPSHWRNTGASPFKLTWGSFLFWWEFLVTDRLKERRTKVEVLKPGSHDDHGNEPGL